MNHLRFLRIHLYSMKREYGVPISIYRQTVSDSNLTTGVKSIVRQVYDIERAPVIPVDFKTVAFYTAAFLKFAREFAYGGFKDVETKRIIIDGEDLPVGFEIIPEDYIVYNSKRFEIKIVERLENNIGFQLIAQYLTGSPNNAIYNLSVTHNIRFLHKVEGAI